MPVEYLHDEIFANGSLSEGIDSKTPGAQARGRLRRVRHLIVLGRWYRYRGDDRVLFLLHLAKQVMEIVVPTQCQDGRGTCIEGEEQRV